MTRVIPFFRVRNSAVLVKLDPEEGDDPEDKADHEQERTTKYEAYKALLFRSGMGDTEGGDKRFHQKVENAIHSVSVNPFRQNTAESRTSGHRLRIFINSICLPCAIFVTGGLEWI